MIRIYNYSDKQNVLKRIRDQLNKSHCIFRRLQMFSQTCVNVYNKPQGGSGGF